MNKVTAVVIGVGAATGALVGAVGVPVVLVGIGFTSAGIAAGSYAAGMMSSVAIANGGAVAAGSTVAVLQAAGATGLSAFTTAAMSGAGAAVGWLAYKFRG
ncbi:hypothetical protein NQZ68_023837 [Dissostichus eleginoides]|nr:hypothetical protein NQZ68_023837 [Dissostichus eleginoides]